MQRLRIPALVLIGLGILTVLIGIAFLQGQFAAVQPLFGIVFLAAGLVMSIGAVSSIGSTQKPSAAADYELIVCPNCHKETLTTAANKNSWCTDCERKKRARLQIAGLTFLLVIALPLTLQLTRQNQDIREQAAEQKTNAPLCDPGTWQPETCACGTWKNSNDCSEDEFSRNCNNQAFCCKTPESGVWECRLLE